jgi:hypothetical protein
VRNERRDCYRPLRHFTSHLVTLTAPPRRFDQPPQGFAMASALVTLTRAICSAAQRLERFSSLVTVASLAPLPAPDHSAPRATPARAARAAGRKSSPDSSAASVVDWLSCSPRGTPAPNNSAAERACADRSETTSGNSRSDAVWSSFSQVPGSSWDRSMPVTPRLRIKGASSARFPSSQA